MTSITPDDASAKMARIRSLLSGFDWETSDRQYALEAIDRIVFDDTAPAGGTSPMASPSTPKIQITGRDWDMSDWPPEEITVNGIVMPLEGCGGDEDRAAVVDAYGRELHVVGVRRQGSRVELVVDTEAPGR